MIQQEWTLKHYGKWEKPDRKGYILHESIYVECSGKANVQTENRLVVARGFKKREMESDCWWVWGSLGEGDKNVLQLGSFDGCGILWTY